MPLPGGRCAVGWSWPAATRRTTRHWSEVGCHYPEGGALIPGRRFSLVGGGYAITGKAMRRWSGCVCTEAESIRFYPEGDASLAGGRCIICLRPRRIGRSAKVAGTSGPRRDTQRRGGTRAFGATGARRPRYEMLHSLKATFNHSPFPHAARCVLYFSGIIRIFKRESHGSQKAARRIKHIASRGHANRRGVRSWPFARR